MTKEKLQLNRKFLVIESPIPFEIYCPEQDDGVKRRQGSWQMTIHDLLTKSHYPLNPIYNLELIYDETLLAENESVSWYTTDLNLGEALRGIDGQLVTWDYAEHLNVNDFSFNGQTKNTVRKIFDDLNYLLNYLDENFTEKIVLRDLYLSINGYGGSIEEIEEYRYDRVNSVLSYNKNGKVKTFNVSTVVINRQSGIYYLQFLTSDLLTNPITGVSKFAVHSIALVPQYEGYNRSYFMNIEFI